MKRLFLLTVCSLLGLHTTFAQTEVTNYQPGVTNDGITYFLPTTGIRVVVTAIKTHYIPGEFSEYAERYLRLKDVPLTAYDEWSITDVKLCPFGLADKSKAYSIKFKQKTSAPLVTLCTDGRLLAINAKVNNNAETLPTASVIPSNEKVINGTDFKTEEILSAGSTAKMAELTANEIYDIRENRGLLTKGQADFMPKDGEQLKLMLSNLDTQEEGLLQLFRGTKANETYVFTFDVVPNSELNKQLVFNFSRYLGMVDADDPAGTAYYISVNDLKTLPELTNQEQSSKPKKEFDDLRYIVPGRAKVTITTEDGKECASQSIPMAQFGRVEHLGGELFNKKNTTHVLLSPLTGGINKIEAAKPE